MKAVPAALLAATLLLSGCSVWNNTLDYVGLDDDSAPPPAADTYTPPPAPAAAAPPQTFVQTAPRPLPAVPPLPGTPQAAAAQPVLQHGSNSFCDSVATQQSNRIAADGASAATVVSTYIGVYNSCASGGSVPVTR